MATERAEMKRKIHNLNLEIQDVSLKRNELKDEMDVLVGITDDPDPRHSDDVEEAEKELDNKEDKLQDVEKDLEYLREQLKETQSKFKKLYMSERKKRKKLKELS